MDYECLLKNSNIEFIKPCQCKTHLNLSEGIPDYIFKAVSIEQREILKYIVYMVLIISVIANLATIIVNAKRKMRIFFRILLFSLAGSDLLTTIFIATNYIAQFTDKFIQLWHLGDIMCACIPFMSTAAILINSMTLVGIAFDRYMAVMKVMSGVNWEPGLLCCFAFIILVWGLAAGLSSPMLMAYYTKKVLIIITNPIKPNECIDVRIAELCFADKALTSFYYIIIFSVVFIPMILTFIWLNSIIAKEIWNRRKFNKNSEHNITTHTSAITKTKTILTTKMIRDKIKEKNQQESSVTIKSIKTLSEMDKKNIDCMNINCLNSEKNTEQNSTTSNFNSGEILETPSTLRTTLDKQTSNEDDTNNTNNIENNNNNNNNYQENDINILTKDQSTKITVSVNIINIQPTNQSISINQSSAKSEIISTIGVQMQCSQKIQQQQFHHESTIIKQQNQNIPQTRYTHQHYTSHRRREARQLRLFIVIILLMSIFLICRLPTWIFLLLSLYGKHNTKTDWILYYCFGLLSLLNCILNPFCYTFISETTRIICLIVKFCKRQIKNAYRIISIPFIYIWNQTIIKYCKNKSLNDNEKQQQQQQQRQKQQQENISSSFSKQKSNSSSNVLDVANFTSNQSKNFGNGRKILKRSRSQSYNCDQTTSYDSKEIYTIFQQK